MRQSTNYNFPVAEDEDFATDFPSLIDGPRTDQIDALFKTNSVEMVAPTNVNGFEQYPFYSAIFRQPLMSTMHIAFVAHTAGPANQGWQMGSMPIEFAPKWTDIWLPGMILFDLDNSSKLCIVIVKVNGEIWYSNAYGAGTYAADSIVMCSGSWWNE